MLAGECFCRGCARLVRQEREEADPAKPLREAEEARGGRETADWNARRLSRTHGMRPEGHEKQDNERCARTAQDDEGGDVEEKRLQGLSTLARAASSDKDGGQLCVALRRKERTSETDLGGVADAAKVEGEARTEDHVEAARRGGKAVGSSWNGSCPTHER